jgi:hypothetical protein
MIEDAVVCIAEAVGEAFRKYGPNWAEVMGEV